MGAPVKVLFIAGMTRSGSTVLASLLNQCDGIVSVGELTTVWRNGLIENRRCGCHAPFYECEFWSRVFDDRFKAQLDAVEQVADLGDSLRTKIAVGRVMRGHLASLRTDASRYSEVLGRVYRRIHEQADGSVIVDSSKYPWHGYLAGHAPGVDLRVLHIVRDPRAVVYSWGRGSTGTAGAGRTIPMPRHSLKRSAFHWMMNNALSELLQEGYPVRRPYLRLKYEEIVRHPRSAILGILEWVGEPGDGDFFLDSRTARLDRPIHQLAGNPVRFQAGAIEITIDDEWTRAMRRLDRALTGALTWPLRLRYGYGRTPVHRRRRDWEP